MNLYNEIKRLLNQKVRIQVEGGISEVIVADVSESVIRTAEVSTGEPLIFQISNIGFIEYI